MRDDPEGTQLVSAHTIQGLEISGLGTLYNLCPNSDKGFCERGKQLGKQLVSSPAGGITHDIKSTTDSKVYNNIVMQSIDYNCYNTS